MPGLFTDRRLQPDDQVLQRLGIQVSVQRHPVLRLLPLQDFLESLTAHTHDDTAEHHNEPPIGVLREPFIPGPGSQPVDSPVIQPNVQHRIHHARHRRPGARPHRHQERIVGIPEAGFHRAFHLPETVQGLFPHPRGIDLAATVVLDAGFGRDGEPGRHGDPEIGHFGQAGALPAEQFLHLAGPFGLSVPEIIDKFLRAHACPLLLASPGTD